MYNAFEKDKMLFPLLKRYNFLKKLFGELVKRDFNKNDYLKLA